MQPDGSPTQPTSHYRLHPASSSSPARAGKFSIILLITVFAALAAAAVALYIAVQAMGTVDTLTAQNRQLRNQMASLKFSEHNDYATVNGKVITLGRALAPILPYTVNVCSQDLTGPNGPAQFWFLCSNQRP